MTTRLLLPGILIVLLQVPVFAQRPNRRNRPAIASLACSTAGISVTLRTRTVWPTKRTF